jgi:hypothetical protein
LNGGSEDASVRKYIPENGSCITDCKSIDVCNVNPLPHNYGGSGISLYRLDRTDYKQFHAVLPDAGRRTAPTDASDACSCRSC